MSYRLTALRQIGGFYTGFRTNGEDLDAGIRMNAAGFDLLYLPEVQVFHQRSDNVASLERTMAAWYSAAYHAKWQNHAAPWTLLAGTLRRVITDPLKDIVIQHDPDLVPLSLELSRVKFKALRQAAIESSRIGKARTK